MIPGVPASTLDEDRPDASEGQHDRALNDLARRVTGAWPLVAAVWEELRARHGIYLRADTGANDQIAFLFQAMAIADRSNLLRRFAFELLKKDLVDGEFGTAVAKFLATRGDVSLQRYENNAFQSVSALVAGRRLLLACEQVCRIDIDGCHAGTGVLVAPTFVATAAHVVHDLLDLAIPHAPRQKAGSLGRLALHFGDVEDFADAQSAGSVRRPSDLKPAVLRDQWLAYASLATDNERSTTFDINDVFGIGLPEGPWDLALIELAEPPRPALAAAACHERPLSKTGAGVHVLHHPNGGLKQGMPLLWSIGHITGVLGAPDALPTRLLHDANTAAGSSGAPCFNDNWEIVGLHQAGRRDTDRTYPSGPNRAVPIYHWLDRLRTLAPRGNTPYIAETDGPTPHPILGRRHTQDRIWRAMQNRVSHVGRLFIIRGDAGTGKSFTASLVKAMVRGRGDIVVEVDVRNVQGDDAWSFVAALKAALSSTSETSAVGRADGAKHDGGTVEPDLEVVLTKPARIVRSEAAPSLMNALAFLGGRTEQLWLILDGFEAANLASPSGIPQVVGEMMARLDAIPGLRLILLGWKDAVDPSLAGAIEELVGPSAADVVDHLSWRYFPPARVLDASPNRDKARALFESMAAIAVPDGIATGPNAYDRVLTALLTARPFLDMAAAQPAAEGGP
ncbi:trypsin-like peptidase domain-containing protein [Methylobacterium fujisawaense]